MESKILLSADTPCDIGPELTERYQVSLFPLHIILEGRQYTDGLDITPNDLYDAWYTRKALPKIETSVSVQFRCRERKNCFTKIPLFKCFVLL